MAFRLPTYKQRATIVGRTGSGKTQFGAWLLSVAPFDKQPYVIVDYKRDELLNSVDGIQEISLNQLPKKPGLYIVHPRPDQEEEVEAWLWRVWEHERIGLYFDEAYALPKNSKAFVAILTQGRSKRIPAIVLCQRPSWISRFVFSEADFFTVFHLNDDRDKKTLAEMMPKDVLKERVPDYHSHWFDVASNERFTMKPVPDAATIIASLETRLKAMGIGSRRRMI